MAPPQRRWRQLLSEPLLHFVLIGVLVFGAYRAFNPAPQSIAHSNVIELTDDDLIQMTMTWRAQGRPAPTVDQVRNLVEARVREEILAREAVALGLDKDDTVIKRRLAQKMEFLAEDLSSMAEPTSAELEAWFNQNAERLTLPARVSFRHLYFSPDRRGTQAGADAKRALVRLTGEHPDTPAAAEIADAFMFQDSYGDRSSDDLFKLFGPNFTQKILKLEPGAWRGPIESGYGWHLVFIDSITPARIPALEEVEAEARTQWIEDRRAAVRRKMYETMRTRYQVILPDALGKAVTGALPSTAASDR